MAGSELLDPEVQQQVGQTILMLQRGGCGQEETASSAANAHVGSMVGVGSFTTAAT